jgi:uncharacterized protein YbbK (DUF523 family)/uncharacterized protein YbgA (DUF1722 family)
MRRFPRPRVLISACLEFDNVRYDRKVVPCPVVDELKPFVDFIKVCPESAIGLGVPRDPLRIVKVGVRERLIQPRTGRDLTEQMDAFTDRFLASLPPVDGFLFKSGSPTIGFYNIKVYDHPVGPGVAGRTSGLFAHKILHHYPGYPVEDDLRLRNRKICDEFLTKVFSFAGFREAAETGDPGAVRGFHDRNRYLFMCYDPGAWAALGGALARGDNAEYLDEMRLLLSNPRTADAYAGVALHIFERYRDQLSSVETAWFRELVTKYMKNKVSRDGLLEALELFAIQKSDWQMADQTLFTPYPRELVPDADEERDRDYRKTMSIT